MMRLVLKYYPLLFWIEVNHYDVEPVDVDLLKAYYKFARFGLFEFFCNFYLHHFFYFSLNMIYGFDQSIFLIIFLTA